MIKLFSAVTWIMFQYAVGNLANNKFIMAESEHKVLC